MSDPGIRLGVCGACGAGFFPPRLICPRCGGGSWREMTVSGGTVEDATVVHRAIGGSQAPTVLATIRLATGQRILAKLPQMLPRGASVMLEQEAGAIRALTKQP